MADIELIDIVTGLTEDTTPDTAADFVVTYDTSAALLKKVKPENLVGAGGSIATDAIFDAKGDLPIGTGADTAAKLTVGANDSVIIADSTQTTGIKWITQAALKTLLALVKGDVGLGNVLNSVQEVAANKDATGGYAGLTLYKINFKNAANTFTSFFTNTNTAARTYTFQDRDGTIADNTDLSGKQATLVSGTNIKTVNSTSLLGSGDVAVQP